ncbi:hypothetical protein RFI_17531 [Reticulomyxa filosa]|uniref:Uncharacterized protein n=1 Tax=Reticulomyxa filosa TaxID=46433 RepID=X6N1T3_RETFI|nr:hypothetical protein RFI_17531 [Reticulomyxa filosa]|eukprot:ETO19699.1 hypothetical protein RFI_17531 [Reticulomyxa filosa]
MLTSALNRHLQEYIAMEKKNAQLALDHTKTETFAKFNEENELRGFLDTKSHKVMRKLPSTENLLSAIRQGFLKAVKLCDEHEIVGVVRDGSHKLYEFGIIVTTELTASLNSLKDDLVFDPSVPPTLQHILEHVTKVLRLKSDATQSGDDTMTLDWEEDDFEASMGPQKRRSITAITTQDIVVDRRSKREQADEKMDLLKNECDERECEKRIPNRSEKWAFTTNCVWTSYENIRKLTQEKKVPMRKKTEELRDRLLEYLIYLTIPVSNKRLRREVNFVQLFELFRVVRTTTSECISQIMISLIVQIVLPKYDSVVWNAPSWKDLNTIELITDIVDREWGSIVMTLLFYLPSEDYLLCVKRCIYLFAEFITNYFFKMIPTSMDPQLATLAHTNVQMIKGRMVAHLNNVSSSLGDSLVLVVKLAFLPLECLLDLLKSAHNNTTTKKTESSYLSGLFRHDGAANSAKVRSCLDLLLSHTHMHIIDSLNHNQAPVLALHSTQAPAQVLAKKNPSEISGTNSRGNWKNWLGIKGQGAGASASSQKALSNDQVAKEMSTSMSETDDEKPVSEKQMKRKSIAVTGDVTPESQATLPTLSNTLSGSTDTSTVKKTQKTDFERKLVEFYRKDFLMDFQEILYQLTEEEQIVSHSVLRQETEIRQTKSMYFGYFDISHFKRISESEKIMQKFRILQRITALRGLTDEESKRVLKLCTETEIEEIAE